MLAAMRLARCCLAGVLVALGACASNSSRSPLTTSEQAVSSEVCRTETIHAGRTYEPSQALDGERRFLTPMRFAVPDELRVVAGNAGNHKAEFAWRLGNTTTTCTYRGGASKSHPSTLEDLGAGAVYKFERCTDGSAAGALVTADSIRAHVQSGDHLSGSTRIEVVVHEISPCATGTAVENERAGTPRVLLTWIGGLGSLSAAENLTVRLTNTRSEPVTATLQITAMGLDGRADRVTVGSYEMLGDGTLVASVPLAGLPVQSIGTWSQVQATARYVELAGQAFESPSSPLFYMFDSDYARVTVATQDPSPRLGATGALRQELVALSAGLRSVRGRVLDHSTQVPQFVDIATLRSGPVMLGASTAFATLPGDFFPPPKKPAPDDSDAPGSRFCMHWKAGFFDSGGGEDSLNGTVSSPLDVPARYASARILATSSAAPVWEGHLNAAGCTPPLNLAPGSYLAVYNPSMLRGTTAFEVDEESSGLAPAPDELITVTAIATPFDLSTGALPSSILLVPAVHRHWTRVAAVAGEILVADDMGLRPSRTYRATLVRVIGARGDSSGLEVGPNGVGVPHNSYWKFVIAHEFGHVVQDIATGLLEHNYKDTSTSEPLCRCDHVDPSDPDNSLHCVQSREFAGAAHVEGFAHFYAAKLFNNSAESDCTFVYYKEFLKPVIVPPILPPMNFVVPPPSPISCSAPKTWMETYCAEGEAGKGVEWDWLNFLRSINITTAPNSISLADFNAILFKACGDASCTGKVRSFENMASAASTLYGGDTDLRTQRFRAAGNANGVNH